MEILRIRRHRGFTLVEMLIVIVIIGMLATLLLVAFGGARIAAQNTVIKTDITQLNMALENYRLPDYGGNYPPDFIGCNYHTNPFVANDPVRVAARAAVLRHVRSRFPRYAIPPGTIDAQFIWFATQVSNATVNTSGQGIDITKMNPSRAMVFWLGGLPTYAGSNELVGFSTNPLNPIDVSNPNSNRTPRLFQFDAKKLLFATSAGGWTNDPNEPTIDATSPLAYGSATSQGRNNLIPILYFRAPVTPYADDAGTPTWYLTALWDANVMPYADSNTLRISAGVYLLSQLRWMNSERPQIVSVGLDGTYGWVDNTLSAAPSYPLSLPVLFPSGGNLPLTDLGTAHRDNVTNFTGSATLKDEFLQ